jgi:hypothetical protein
VLAAAVIVTARMPAEDYAKTGVIAFHFDNEIAPLRHIDAVHFCPAPARAQAGGHAVRIQVHGGKSTGPRTPEGLERSRRANWKHGYYSREAEAERSRLRTAILAMCATRSKGSTCEHFRKDYFCRSIMAGSYANGANAKPTGLPGSASRQGRVCAAGNRSRHCELDPVGRAVVVHSRRLRRRVSFRWELGEPRRRLPRDFAPTR